LTAGRQDRAPMLYHMRKKPSLAGRRGMVEPKIGFA
jgi:hypothetical protein